MSGNTRRIYPPDQRILFDGGKNSKFERSIISDNESPDCANVVFTNGGVETRQGAQKLSTTTVGTAVFDGIYTRRADDGNETMVVFAGTHMKYWSGSTFTTVPSGQSVFTAGFRVSTTQYENKMFIGNGGVIPYKYDGTTLTRHGVYPPVTAPVAATSSAGVLSGVYSYKVVYVNTATVSGNPSPVSNTLTVAGGVVIGLTGISVAPQSFGVASRKLYRTADAGTTYKLLATIADNTTTTYADNIADAALGATAPSDNGIPPLYSLVVYHANRLFVNDPDNPNYLWYSNLGEPYTFGATNFVKVGDSTSDLIKGLSVYNDSVVCFCEKSVHFIYMPTTDSADWQTIKANSPYGSKAPYCLLPYNNKLLFPAMDAGYKFVGFAALEGSTVAPSATFNTVTTAGGDLKSQPIETDMFTVVNAYQGNISGIVHKNKAYISLTYDSGNTTNNRIYVMDFSIENLGKKQEVSWVPWTGLSAAQFTVLNGTLYYASSTTSGFVYSLETGVYNDATAAIDSYYFTKEFPGYKQDLNYHKDYRYAKMLVELTGAYYMNVNYRTDSDSGSGDTQQIYLSSGGSNWGSFYWGIDNWGGGHAQSTETIELGPANGERIQFKFSNQNTADQKFKVHWMQFAYNRKGFR